MEQNPGKVAALYAPDMPPVGVKNEATGDQGRQKRQLLTVRDVADFLHVPVSWVYGRTRKRSVERLPGYRLGKYWRFREEDIMAWLESQDSKARSA